MFVLIDDNVFLIFDNAFSVVWLGLQVMFRSHYPSVTVFFFLNGINVDTGFLEDIKTAFGLYQNSGQALCSYEYNLAALYNIFEHVKMCLGCCSI